MFRRSDSGSMSPAPPDDPESPVNGRARGSIRRSNSTPTGKYSGSSSIFRRFDSSSPTPSDRPESPVSNDSPGSNSTRRKRGNSVYGSLRIPDKISTELLDRALSLEKEVESYKERNDILIDQATFVTAQDMIFEIQETVMNWKKKGAIDRIKISRTGDTLAVKYRKLFESQDMRLKDVTNQLRSTVQRASDSIEDQKRADEKKSKRQDEMLSEFQLTDGMRGTIVDGLEELATLNTNMEAGTHKERKKSVIMEIQLDNRKRRGSKVAANIEKLYRTFEKVSGAEIEDLEQMIALHDEVSEMLDAVRMYHFTNWEAQLSNLDEPGSQSYFAVKKRRDVVNAAFIRFGCISTLSQWFRCVSYHITACRNVQTLDKDALHMNKEEMVDKLIAITARASVCILSLDGNKEEISKELNAMKLCELPLDAFSPQLAELLSAMEVLGEDIFSIAAKEMLLLRNDRPGIRKGRAPVVASIVGKALKLTQFLIGIGRDQGLLPLCSQELVQMYEEARSMQKKTTNAPVVRQETFKGLSNTIDDEIDIEELQQINQRLKDLKVRQSPDAEVVIVKERSRTEEDCTVQRSRSEDMGENKNPPGRFKFFKADSHHRARRNSLPSPNLRGLSMPPRRRNRNFQRSRSSGVN